VENQTLSDVVQTDAKRVLFAAKSGDDCSPALLSHISPLGWAHILLTGEYWWKNQP
jgi:hypothetical protein